jgi:hypothetical protein
MQRVTMEGGFWMRRTTPGAAVVLASWVAVACGGGSSPVGGSSSARPAANALGASSSVSVSACTVLDAHTASVALGVPVGAPQPDDGGATCSYDASDDSGANVHLEMHAVRGNASADDLVARNAQPVSGLGDKAFWNDGLATLVVYRGQGDVVVQVVLPGGATAGAEDRARAIAQKALSSF